MLAGGFFCRCHAVCSRCRLRLILCESLWLFFRALRIGNKLHQRAVGIAKIDAAARPLGAEALERAALDGDTAAFKMDHGLGDRSAPFEAQIAVAGRDRKTRHLRRLDARPVDVELTIAEAIGVAGWPRHQLGAEHRRIERIGAFPVGHVNDAMIERHRKHRFSPFAATAGPARAATSVSSRSRACRKASCRAPERSRSWHGPSR